MYPLFFGYVSKRNYAVYYETDMTQCKSCQTKKYHYPSKDYGTYDFFDFPRRIFFFYFYPCANHLPLYPKFFALNASAKFVDKENILNKFVNMQKIRKFCIKLSHFLTLCYISRLLVISSYNSFRIKRFSAHILLYF